MRSAFIVAMVLLANVETAGRRDPSSIDPELCTVVSTGYHRFLEYRVCSPEHCWSEAYLQWRSDERILATTQISEIGYGRGVDSAVWKWSGEAPRLELRIAPSHGGFEPYTLTILPGAEGKYAASEQH